MDKLLVLLQAKTVKLLLEKILYSLDIVVGYLLDVLDALSLNWRKILIDSTKLCKDCFVNIYQLW